MKKLITCLIAVLTFTACDNDKKNEPSPEIPVKRCTGGADGSVIGGAGGQVLLDPVINHCFAGENIPCPVGGAGGTADE